MEGMKNASGKVSLLIEYRNMLPLCTTIRESTYTPREKKMRGSSQDFRTAKKGPM